MQIWSALPVISTRSVPREARTFRTAVVTGTARPPIRPACWWPLALIPRHLDDHVYNRKPRPSGDFTLLGAECQRWTWLLCQVSWTLRPAISAWMQIGLNALSQLALFARG